jgi:ribosomal protein L32
MAHKDSGIRCTVAHFEGSVPLPSCIQCKNCKEYIRPEDMNKNCPKDKSDRTK